MHYFIEPEVAGGWGDGTVADRTTHPPGVSKLHYQFDGWLGDELLESFPCFLVTENLKNNLILANLTGFEIDDVEVSKSEDFFAEDKFSNLENFFWLKITGREESFDFYLAPDHRLVASEAALKVLQNHRISHADIIPI